MTKFQTTYIQIYILLLLYFEIQNGYYTRYKVLLSILDMYSNNHGALEDSTLSNQVLGS